MSNDKPTTDKERVYNCWGEDFPGVQAEEIEASRASKAVEVWFDRNWCKLDRPDEARVLARRLSDQKLFAFDVYVEDIELDLGVDSVSLDEDGKPIEPTFEPGEPVTAESLDRAARATG
jgi:hypothetical protein